MDSIKIKDTLTTPSINFNSEDNLLEIIGESRPENPLGFYMPLLFWMDDYVNHLISLPIHNDLEVRIVIRLDYFNSSSSLFLKQLLEKTSRLKAFKNIHLNVSWYYDKGDEPILESGKELERILPFLNFTFFQED